MKRMTIKMAREIARQTGTAASQIVINPQMEQSAPLLAQMFIEGYESREAEIDKLRRKKK